MTGDERDAAAEGAGSEGEAGDWTDAELARLQVSRPPGGGWGCGLGTLFFLCCLPLVGAVLFGHGGPTPGAKSRALFELLGSAVVLGGLFALAVRTLVNAGARGRAKAALWTVAVALAGGAALVSLWYDYWLRGG